MLSLLSFHCNTSRFFAANSEFLAGAVLPFTLAVIGLVGPIFFFEWAVRQPYFQNYLITYKQGQPRYKSSPPSDEPTWKELSTNGRTYNELVNMAMQRVPFIALLASVILYGLQLDMFSARALSDWPPLWTMILQYVAYYYSSDGLAFLLHYAVHKNSFLWRHVHSMHHQEHTPTSLSGPYSTLYDYFMFGGIPNIAAAAILQPHAVVFYAGVLTNMYGVAYLHSGIQHPVFDFFLSMGYLLPFHASSRLHDRHHRSAGRKLQDLGEHLWLWDYLAGTLTPGPV